MAIYNKKQIDLFFAFFVLINRPNVWQALSIKIVARSTSFRQIDCRKAALGE
jgi:hypothetical protein